MYIGVLVGVRVYNIIGRGLPGAQQGHTRPTPQDVCVRVVDA